MMTLRRERAAWRSSAAGARGKRSLSWPSRRALLRRLSPPKSRRVSPATGAIGWISPALWLAASVAALLQQPDVLPRFPPPSRHRRRLPGSESSTRSASGTASTPLRPSRASRSSRRPTPSPGRARPQAPRQPSQPPKPSGPLPPDLPPARLPSAAAGPPPRPPGGALQRPHPHPAPGRPGHARRPRAPCSRSDGALPLPDDEYPAALAWRGRPRPEHTDAAARPLRRTSLQGSGKTLAFLLPIVISLQAHEPGGVRAVVLSPTHELASQARAGEEDNTRGFLPSPVRRSRVPGGRATSFGGPAHAAHSRSASAGPHPPHPRRRTACSAASTPRSSSATPCSRRPPPQGATSPSSTSSSPTRSASRDWWRPERYPSPASGGSCSTRPTSSSRWGARTRIPTRRAPTDAHGVAPPAVAHPSPRPAAAPRAAAQVRGADRLGARGVHPP